MTSFPVRRRFAAAETILMLLFLATTGCSNLALRNPGGWTSRDAAATSEARVRVNEKGQPIRVQYDVAPSDVPRVVREAMDRLYPGTAFYAARRCVHGDEPRWELERDVDEFRVEALFEPDGILVEAEIDVPSDAVPTVVRDAIRAAVPNGQVTRMQEIRDRRRRIRDYAATVTSSRFDYRIVVRADGQRTTVRRIIPMTTWIPTAR